MQRVRAVVLSTDPVDGNPPAWREHLLQAGVDAVVLGENPAELPHADLVVSHVLLGGGTPHPTFHAAQRYEQRGTPMTNSTMCLSRCADKWQTTLAWRAAGLPQPRTWHLDELTAWPEVPVLLKPALGESARGICVAADRQTAIGVASGWQHHAIVQEVVPTRSVLRVHATPDQVLGAYARPAASISGLPAPDPSEHPVPLTQALHRVATNAVRAVGGGLIGLDIIDTAAGPLLLEANPPFLFPGHLPDLATRIVRAAMEMAATTDDPAPAFVPALGGCASAREMMSRGLDAP